ncbi:hypothetical protein [Zobellia uliginosa]|nr:hypothetical protein [Zobellia uliginosa]
MKFLFPSFPLRGCRYRRETSINGKRVVQLVENNNKLGLCL